MLELVASRTSSIYLLKLLDKSTASQRARVEHFAKERTYNICDFIQRNDRSESDFGTSAWIKLYVPWTVVDPRREEGIVSKLLHCVFTNNGEISPEYRVDPREDNRSRGVTSDSALGLYFESYYRYK